MRKYKRIKKLQSKQIKAKRIKLFLFLSILILIILFVFVLFKVSDLGKFIFVNNVDGGAELTVIDPQKSKIVKIIIPGDTQITSSRGFGTYKVNSLWKLGDKEGYDGKLVAESVRRSFLLPLYLWKDGTKTNLNTWQRIRFFLLERKISNYDISTISLAKINVLKQKNIADGTSGYIISSKIPESISIYFVEPAMGETIAKIEIEDLTGNISVTEDVSKLLGVMGAKITSYTKGFDENLDCEVIGKDKTLIEVVSANFNCTGNYNPDISVDLKIRLGKRFVDRF